MPKSATFLRGESRRLAKLPSYRLHKARQCAVVTIDGKNHYLGPYDSGESKEKYARLIGELAVRNGSPAPPPSNEVTVNELMLAYWNWAQAYYVKDGRPTGQLPVVKLAFRDLRILYDRTRATAFGPVALRTLQQRMIDRGIARSTINSLIGVVKHAFKWAASNELLPVTVYQALATVPGLKRGRTTAREADPVLPVADEVVEATLPHLPAVIADMVRFQRLVGCRPGEVCGLRPCDVDTSGELWVYRPESHKTQHHGRERRIFIGPKAQDILRPYLLRDHQAACFSPVESEKKRRVEQRSRRKTRVQPSQAKRRPKANPKRPVRNQYCKDGYNRAVRRALMRAEDQAHLDNPDVPLCVMLVSPWSPNQLRHAAATEIRRRYGIEGAQVCLGHSRADVTQVYAERDFSLAARIMAEVG